jgi:membrane associated rhomboid family serine protease
MIPLGDSIRSLSRPVVNYCIIAACVAVWVAELLSPEHLAQYTFVPSQLISPEAWREVGLANIVLRMFTSMFMHDPGGPWHLGFNMLFLWVFGDNVEDRMGHGRYAVFYLVCGLVAALAHSLLSFFSDTPILGASGAIAGVLGAYFVMFKGARVRALVPIIFIFTVMELPAVVFLGLWFVFQLFSGFGTIGGTGGGVAFWAHIGGFVAGLLLARRFAVGGPRPGQPRVVRVRFH